MAYSTSAPTSHAIASGPLGNSGASCFAAHQTTAASAIRETRAWMSAKRRFMKRLADCRAGGTGVPARGNWPGSRAGVHGSSRVRITPRTQSLRCGAPASHPDIPGHPRRLRRAAGRGLRARRRARSAERPAGAAAARAAAPAGGAGAPWQAARLRGADRTPAARRHLVLPPGRHAHPGRHRALVRAARPERLAGDPRAARLERARHHAQPLLGRLVPQGVQAAQGPQGRAQANVLEGPLRGGELPHQGLAERQDDRRLHGLLPVRGATSTGCARGATRWW